jgi:alcohol dehydrogenase (cytochrome c)
MKTFCSSVALAIAVAGAASAQTAEDLINDLATPGDVLTYGMGYGQQRYSALDQINADNVGNLTPQWVYSMNDGRGQESFPLIKDGVMYVTNHAATMALDARTGKQIWKSTIDYPAETPRVVCCGIVNRGAAMFDGKLYRTTLDANVMAIDAATGEEVWKTNSIDFKDGYSFTVAPLIADGVVIVGISGGEYGIRGYIEGYDAMTGERLWRTYTIPAPGEPGSETWPEGDAWERGSGPAWLTGTYDPDLNTVYWGVGNAGPWNASVRDGDNLYTLSALALDPKTGNIKWHYQFNPNDPFDYDGTNELVMAELEGQKVIMQANRNGFYYVINRETGKLISAEPFVDKLTWADGVDLETGRPIETKASVKARAGEQVEIWPSVFGGKNWAPMSFNPETNTAFINSISHGMNYKAVEPAYRAGTFYFGVEFSWVQNEEYTGSLRAFDPVTGEVKWSTKDPSPRMAGILSTGGDILFTGAQTGEFEAFATETGEKLYEFNVGTGIIGQPVTYELDGRQYVSLSVGSGGAWIPFTGDPNLANVPAGGAVWTFALPQ